MSEGAKSEGTRPKPRVVAIIQARMGSTRLPGKVMRAIAGKPLLWHVIHRLGRCRTLDQVAIATSTNPHDDPIAHFADTHGLACARGSEHNVLARYLLAAWQTNADIIVRVSSDAPFVDPGFIDHMVESLIAQDGDYVTLPPGTPCAHEGVDPFSQRALEKLAREAAHEPVAREHVTGYFKVKPDFVRVVHAPVFDPLAREPARVTIDTPDDLAFAEAVHQRLEAKAGEASLADLLWLIEKDPNLKRINAHVKQKPIGLRASFALLRCDGGMKRGYGHVRRMLMLARAMRDREGMGVAIAFHGDGAAAWPLREAGFEVIMLPDKSTDAVFRNVAFERHPDIVVADCRDDLSPETLKDIARSVPVVAVIDDASDRRLAATHAYYPPVTGAEALSWYEDGKQIRVGWDWTVLGFDPSHRAPRTERTALEPPRVVVSLGGSDPFGYTRLVARALERVTTPFEARFIIGPGFAGPDQLVRDIESMSAHFTAVRNADAAYEFANADLAVAAFGVSAYELAALGTPALYIGLYEDHLESSRSFEQMGLGRMLGIGNAISEYNIAHAVAELLGDETHRKAMSAAGPATIDGKGAERIAADLACAVEAKRALSAVKEAS